MNKVILYHNDLDGVASAAIALEKIMSGDVSSCDSIEWTYGRPVPDLSKYSEIIMLDISFDSDTMTGLVNSGKDVTWIDHHHTAITASEQAGYSGMEGIREVGTAACELTWEYYNPGEPCPTAIQYLGAYDVWNKDRFKWDDVIAFQYYSRAEIGLDIEKAIEFLYTMAEDHFIYGIRVGKAIIRFVGQKNENECRQHAFEATVFGHKAICMNTLEFNSTAFDSIYDPEVHDLMIPFAYTPDRMWRLSLYTTKDIDCGVLAQKLGGGGHAKAAGFRLTGYKMNEFLETRCLTVD